MSSFHRRAHLFPHFTEGARWYGDDVPIVVRGEGVYVWDEHGRRFLDALSGLFCVNLGYGRADLADAAARQMRELAYATNWSAAHPSAIRLATRIAELAPGDLGTVFFVSSGSEAVESAMKFARQYHRSNGQPERVKFLAREHAYHGTTMGALTLNGVERYREPFQPLLSGVRHFPSTAGEVLAAGQSAAALPSVQRLLEVIDEEGPETVAGLVVEPVQNAGGALVPPEGYWAELRAICDRFGILLIADEVICAFGRLGEWFGSAGYGATPDLICFAKGVASGYQPLGGIVIRDRFARALLESPLAGTFSHGNTMGGHPVATAVGEATLAALDDEDVLGNVRRHEPHLAGRLEDLLRTHPSVASCRGAGFLHVVEFTGDRQSGRPLSRDEALAVRREVVPAALKRANLTTRIDDRGGTLLVLSPPLISDRTVLDELMLGVDAVCAAVDDHVSGRRQVQPH